MTNIKKVLLNSGYLLGFRLLSRFLSVIFLLYAASRLSPESFGVLSFTLVTVELMSTIGDLGITRYGARELVRHWDGRAVLLGKIFSLQVITSLAMCSAALLLILVLSPSEVKMQLLLLGVASFFFYSIVNTTESAFTASEKFFFSALLTFVGRLIYMAVGFAALASTGSVVLVMWGFLASILLEALLRMAVVTARISRFSFRFPFRELWTMLMICVPFALAGISSVVSYRGNVFILDFLKGDTPVGVYNAAFTLIFPMFWVPLILTWTAYPGLMATYLRDREAARQSAWRWHRLMALAGIPAALAVSLLAGVVPGFFPEGYEEIKPVLIILMWCVPPSMMTAIDFNILQVIDQESVAARGQVMGAVLSLVFSFLIIPFYGGIGAALALLASSLVKQVYFHYQVRANFFQRNALSLFLRPAAAGVAMALVGLFALRVNPWFAAGLGLVVYAVVIVALGAVKPAEIRSLVRRPAGGAPSRVDGAGD